MQSNIKTLPQGMMEITIDIEPDEVRTELEKAAKALSKSKKIDGFRPGKASYETIKTNFGEGAIYEEALPDIVRSSYVKVIKDNDVTVFGEPNINVTKLAPGNTISFTATVALVPKITSLKDFRKIKVKSKMPVIEEKDVDASMKELQKMQTKEIRVNREVREHDKVIVDMDMTRDGVALEGGQAKDHSIYLDENYYIPGLKEQLLGLKEGDKKSFTLKFPTEHYQKHLAGSDVDFAVSLKEVYELQHPPLDDEFAKRLGQESFEKLKELLRGNMERDAEEKENQRAELEILEKIVEKSKFEEIPDKIVNTEIERMVHELKHSVDQRGVEFDDYLKSIKKTLGQLKLDFTPQALKRIKTALVIRDIGDSEKIEIADAEVLEEVERLMNQYTDDAETQSKIKSDEYQDYLRTSIRNRKVLELIRATSIEK